MAVNVEQALQRYLTNGQSAAARQKYIDNINGFQGNPMQLAADQEQLYLQRIQEAVSSGKRRAALLAVNPQTWKQMAATKGAARLGPGMQAAQDKMRAALTKWAPIYDQVHNEVSQMPKGGLAESQARASRAIEILMRAAGRA
jgi:hypothetical protein